MTFAKRSKYFGIDMRRGYLQVQCSNLWGYEIVDEPTDIVLYVKCRINVSHEARGSCPMWTPVCWKKEHNVNDFFSMKIYA